jgi:hypothetical protein
MRKAFTAIAVVLVVLMSASFVAAQGTYPHPGTSVTNVVAMNLATGTGEDAGVVVEYYDTGGQLDYLHENIVIPPLGVQEIKTQDEPLGDAWQGSAVMQSDQPLGVIVSIKNTAVSGDSDGMTQGAYNGTVAPANTLYFPSLYGFQYIVSRITVQNTEDTPADIDMVYYDREGNNLGTQSATLPAFSQRTFYLGDADDVPYDPATFVDGSAMVTSDHLLAGAAVTTWGDRSAAYQALTPANRDFTLYAPSHYRYMVTPASGQWTLFSALNLMNTSETETANVTATYVSRATGDVAMVKEFTIDPLSAVGLNTKNGGDFPASDFADLSYAGGGIADWDGSVQIVSDQELVGVCNTGWDTSRYNGAYELVSLGSASNELFFPAQYRLDWGTGWAQWSAVNLMNVGGSTILAEDLVVEYLDPAGNTVLTLTGTDLPFDLASGGALGLNTRNGGDLEASAFTPMGFSYQGGVHVTAPEGSQLIGVANIVYPNRSSVYNAIQKP